MSVFPIKDGRPVKLVEKQVRVEKFKFNDPQNTADSFHIKWPVGMRILDQHTGISDTVKLL